MKGVLGLSAIVWLLAAAPAVAGTVYRCDGPGGLVYGSKRIAGANCKAIASTPHPRRRTAPVAPAPKPAALPATAPAAATPAGLDANPPATFMGAGASAPKPAAATMPAAPKGRPPTRLVQGQLYSYIKDGVRHYVSRPPKGGAGVTAMRTIRYRFIETCFACAADPGVNFNTLRLNTSAYSAEISAASRQYGVEEAIVRAIIHAESAFNPAALSRVGAQGLMQLMPATARRFGVSNAFDVGQNIQGGVQYLAWLLKRFNGDLTLAAAGYNAGEGAVDRYGGVPPYSETRRYVQRVGVLAQRYRGNVAQQ
ncbi:lytic transglycosylase domain-containing protein [Luteimonas aquatica]|uniref:lytic transglycosylase domain-containing protein n=1 Tax=Luteimonas aquatica TaxID=450364 RepID=UPI001F57102B|nr:lytic transglycosylase domain-containing protein [Luteimonas aquatica]